MERRPYIAEKHKGEISTPQKPAASKCPDEEYAIDDLKGRTCSIQLVEKPVDVDERGGELHQRVLDSVV